MSSEWTVDTLKEYFTDVLAQQEKRYTERFDGQDKAVNAALAAADKAVQAAFAGAEKAINKEEANAERWRQSANEWRSAMNDRENKFALASKVEDIASRMEKREGKSSGVSDSLKLLAGAVALVGTIIGIFAFLR